MAKLPCNKVYFTEDENNVKTPTLVMWFKYGIESPIYSVDFREKKEGSHWSAEKILDSRAYFNVEESVLSIERVRETDAGQYKCRIDFEKFPTKNYVVNLSVTVPPQDVTIVNMNKMTLQSATLTPVMEGQPLQLICIAHGGKPAPQVLWWQNEILMDNQSDIILNNQVQNILHLDHVKRKHHGSILKCEAINGGNRNSLSKVVVINLHLRPLAVRLLGNNEVFSVGREYKITCETYGSRPPANITWLLKGTKIHGSFVDTRISADKNVTTSVLKFQPKFQHHGAKLTCKVTNNHVAGSTLTDSWNLHVQYAPFVKTELGRNLDHSTIKEGVDVYFDCIINANPPAKKIYWTHNGGILVSSSRIIISNQTLVLQSISRQSAGNYCCIAANVEGETQSEPFYLNVKYEPVCSVKQQLVYGAIRHEKIEVICNVDANPDVQSFTWKFNNSLIQIKDVHNFTTAKMYSVATYQPKNELDYGTLLCWARNELGSQTMPCIFHIIPAGKPDTPSNCTVTTNMTEKSLHVSCESGFDGGLPQEFVCEVLTNDSSQLKWNITNRRVPEFTISGVEHDLEYTLIIYSSNGKGRSLNRVELHIPSSTEISERHTRTIGLKGKIFSLWTITLSVLLVLLLCLLFVLMVSILRIRKKHGWCKSKKELVQCTNGTPIHSDDDRNPDIIPQFEEIYTSYSRRPSSSSHTNLKQYATEIATYNTFPSSVHVVNYSAMPMNVESAPFDSVVQWIKPNFLCRSNSRVVINTVPNSSIGHTYNRTPMIPHKESAV